MIVNRRRDRKAGEHRAPRNQRTALYVLAAVLAAALALASVAADGVFGAGASAAPSAPTSSRSPLPASVHVVRELPALRNADSDTYLLSNGSREARVSAHPVNYRDASGNWSPIDDELQQASDGSFHPAASAVPIDLPSSLSSGTVSVGSGERLLSFSLVGAGAGAAAATAGQERTYSDVMPGVSLSYTATPQALRELLTIDSASAPTAYTYTLSYAPGLHPSLEPSGDVVFREATGTTVYTIPAPRVVGTSTPSRTQANSAVHYQLGEGGHTLTLVVSKSYLESASPTSTTPVKIDPEVFFEGPTECTIVSGEYENTSLCNELDIGVEEGTLAAARALLDFNLSAIPRNVQVRASAVELYLNREYYSESALEIEAHALTRSFTEQATWKTFNGTEAWTKPGGDFEAALAGRQLVRPQQRNEWVSYGFDPLVERWVQNPTSNHGVLLKVANESVAGEDNFQPSCGKPCFQPTLTVLYSPRIGEQEEAMVTGAKLADGAEASVNVTNGNLLLESPDVAYTGEGYTTNLSRAYNSQGEGFPDSAFGNGWTLSTGDTTALESAFWDRSTSVQQPGGRYARFDPTPAATESKPFTEVSYKASEHAGASLTMTAEDAGTLTYTETGAKWLFSAGLPTRIEEPQGAGNTIALSYGEAPPHEAALSHLDDTHGHTLTLKRIPSTGEISAIEGTGGKTWHYGYNEAGRLSTYENPEAHKTTYTYNSAGLLHVVEDTSGTYVIAYDTSTPARVNSVRRIVNGTIETVGSKDEIVSFEYTTPHSPTCHPTTDLGETIVRYMPAGTGTETYCYNAAGAITGWNGPELEAEKDPTESEPEEQEEIPTGTCYSNPEFPPTECGEEDIPAENEEAKGGLLLAEPFATTEIPDLGRTHYGIADNNRVSSFNIFTNQYFKELHVVNVRRTVPWDTVYEANHNPNNTVAKAELTDVTTWVKDVKALSKNTGQPTISIDYCAQGEKWVNPQNTAETISCKKAPDKAQYEIEIKEFFANETLKQVKYWTAWNEPNNFSIEGEPTGKEAGEYWRVLDGLCTPKNHNCQVAAGEFVDSDMPDANDKKSKGGKYFAEYVQGMGHPSTAYRWAWHAYSDGAATWTTYHNSTPEKWWTRFKNFHNAINRTTHTPDIWLTEQGVVYNARNKLDAPAHNGGAAKDIMHAYIADGKNQLTRQSREITRFFYYQVKGVPVGPESFDSGLLYPTGTPRPRAIYYTYKNKTPTS